MVDDEDLRKDEQEKRGRKERRDSEFRTKSKSATKVLGKRKKDNTVVCERTSAKTGVGIVEAFERLIIRVHDMELAKSKSSTEISGDTQSTPLNTGVSPTINLNATNGINNSHVQESNLSCC